MSIREQTEDAILLRESGRHFGALTLFLSAIGGSSRKCFHHPDKAHLNRPGGAKYDADAFKTFLGGRLRTNGTTLTDHDQEYGTSGIQIQFRGKMFSLEEILYKFYRCEIAHEGELPEDIEFVVDDSDGLRIECSNTKFTINNKLLNLLENAIVYARCNSEEFGVKHYKFTLKSTAPSRDELAQFLHNIKPEYASRLFVFEEIIKTISPATITASTHEEIQYTLAQFIREGIIVGGMMTSLMFRGLAKNDFSLTDEGVSLLKELAAHYEIVENPFKAT